MPDEGYGHALDRSWEPGEFSGFFSSNRKLEESRDVFNGLSPKIIGISAPPMKDQLESLKARIFQGASKVELGFWGRGKGSMGGGNTTPGMYGKDQREDIKELALINEVELSFHVAPNVYGWAGLQQGKFSEEVRESNVREVERTITFAKDIGRGGAVVIHTGEIPRSAAHKWGHQGFQFHPEDQESAEHLLVNGRTGDIIHSVKNNQKIWLPRYEEDEHGNPLVYDEEMKDEFGDPVKKLLLDPKTKEIKLRETTFAEYVKEQQAKAAKEGRSLTHDDVVKAYYKEQMSVEIEHALGQARHFGAVYHDGIEQRERLKDQYELIKDLQDQLSERDFDSYLRQNFAQIIQSKPGDPTKNVIDYFEKALQDSEHRIKYGRETLSQGKRNAAKIKDTIDNMESVEEYGLKKTNESIARMGMMVYDVTQEKSKEDPHYKPMYIAPENIYPEQYGAHPQELKKIILGSRNEMKKNLMTKGMSEKEAKETAATHIRATFDIGHVNTWWKYYTGTQEEFKQWILDELDDLIEHDIIGHMHVADNFGYEDEHTTPGQGTAPIKEFVEKLANAGVTDMVTEPAHQDWQVMVAGWRDFGGPIYGTNNQDKWTNIQHSYFGRVGPPSFIVGDYAPSHDFRGGPFFSGLPFE